MGDTSRKFQIDIATSFNPTGTQQATEGLNNVGAATKKLGQATEESAHNAEHSGLSHRELHQVLHLIGQESGPAAGAALSGLAAAGTGSVLLLIMAFRELSEVIKESNAEAAELAKTISEGIDTAGFSKGLDEIKKAMYDAQDGADKFEESLRKIESAEESLLEKAQDSIGFIKQELAAELAQAAAEKQALIEEIKAKEALGQITKEHAESTIADLESHSEKEANARKQKARQDEIAELKKAQEANRDAAPDAEQGARDADKARQVAAVNVARQKFLTDQARAALDEGKDGSVSNELKKKQAALDDIPFVSQHDYVLGQKDDADNLKIQIESLKALKGQAETQLAKYGTPESEHSYKEADRQAEEKARAAEDRALKLDTENKSLTKKISDLEQSNKTTTNTENTAAQYHDQARGFDNTARTATADRSAAEKDISDAQRDIQEINHTAAKASTSGVSPEEIAKAKDAVANLHKTLAALPGLLAQLQRLGAPTADLQKQINQLRSAMPKGSTTNQ